MNGSGLASTDRFRRRCLRNPRHAIWQTLSAKSGSWPVLRLPGSRYVRLLSVADAEAREYFSGSSDKRMQRALLQQVPLNSQELRTAWGRTSRGVSPKPKERASSTAELVSSTASTQPRRRAASSREAVSFRPRPMPRYIGSTASDRNSAVVRSQPHSPVAPGEGTL